MKTDFILIFFILSIPVSAQQKALKINDSLVDANALTIDGSFGQSINGKSFQQDALVTFNAWQYFGYYNAERHVCLARRKLPEGIWERIEFTDYNFKSNDAHNTISIGICQNDGTIHLAFDHHGHDLHYRVSKKGVVNQPEKVLWNAALFGPVISELEKDKSIKITYPRFWQTPDGGLQFCYRKGGSGNGDRMLVDYNYNVGKWENTRQIDSGSGVFSDKMGRSDSRCSYPNGYTYGPNGTLHATWVWRESAQGANHDLLYAKSEDDGNTWLNNEGQLFNAPPDVNSPGLIVVNIPREYGLMNTHGQAVDEKGRIHVVMWHCTDKTLEQAGSKPGEFRWGPPEARRYHHYWRNENGEWQHFELPFVVGNRPKIFIDKQNNIYLIFADVNDEKNDLIIAGARAENEWEDWSVIHCEKGPFVNEMLGDYYRWKNEGVLSVIVQEMPNEKHQSTPLRVVDFKFE